MIALLLGCDEDLVPKEGIYMALSKSLHSDCEPRGEVELNSGTYLGVRSVQQDTLTLAAWEAYPINDTGYADTASCNTCVITGGTFECPGFVRPYTVKPNAIESHHRGDGAWIDERTFKFDSWGAFTMPNTGGSDTGETPTEECVLWTEEVYSWQSSTDGRDVICSEPER